MTAPHVDPWFASLEEDDAYGAVENLLLPLLRECQAALTGPVDLRQRIEDAIGRPGRSPKTAHGCVVEDFSDPHWTFDCDCGLLDTYGGENIRQIALEHVRETGHAVNAKRQQWGTFRPEGDD